MLLSLPAICPGVSDWLMEGERIVTIIMFICGWGWWSWCGENFCGGVGRRKSWQARATATARMWGGEGTHSGTTLVFLCVNKNLKVACEI